MDPSLLRSLRAYLANQQEHLLQQQTQQEWLLSEATASLEATQLRLKETRQMLATLPQSAGVAPGSTLAAFLPSFVPTFFQRTFSGSSNEHQRQQEEQHQQEEEHQQEEQHQQEEHRQQGEQRHPEEERQQEEQDQPEEEHQQEEHHQQQTVDWSRKRSASLSAVEEDQEEIGTEHTVSSPAPYKKARHKKTKLHPSSRTVIINKCTHLTTSGAIHHGVAHVTSNSNRTTASSGHASCTAPAPVPAVRARRIASVEVDVSQIPGFDRHVTRNMAGKDPREANAAASGSGHSRTPSANRPPAKDK